MCPSLSQGAILPNFSWYENTQAGHIDHVGLGLDLTTGHEYDDFSLLGYKPEMYQDLWKDGVQLYLEGMENVGKVPAITAGLLARGYSETDTRKIIGDNFARALGSIWG